MEPQDTRDTGVSSPQPQPINTATMPLPSSDSTVFGQQNSERLPVPDVAPPVLLPTTTSDDAQIDATQPQATSDDPAQSIVDQSLTTDDQTAAGAVPATDDQATGGAADAGVPADGAVPIPAVAADSDVIETEWVMKAKHVVATTSQDPYRQVLELNKLRVDYMKKRYNKDINLSED